MPGGSLEMFWKPYSIYLAVDHSYGLDEPNGFINAQSLVNLFEAAMYFVFLYLVYIDGSKRSKSIAVVLAIVATSITGSKTVLFVLQEYYSG